MKISLKNLRLVWIGGLFLFLLSGIVRAQDAGPQAGAGAPKDPTVVLNETLVPKAADTHGEVRHIVLRGSNEAIGEALGKIAQEWLDVKLGKFAAPLYAEASRRYLAEHDPILLERSKGVAKAYGLLPDDNTYNTTALPYDIGPFACSALFIPPDFSANGHAIAGHNMDNYLSTMAKMAGTPEIPGNEEVFSRVYVLELYPDKGYPSIVVGSLDLLSGFQGGINSKGVLVNILTDQKGPSYNGSATAGINPGLNGTQPVRLVLDTCANVEEAKIALLTTKFSPIFEPAHFLVSDKSGQSFAFELSGKDGSPHITVNDGKPMIITNHPLFVYQNVDEFPAWKPTETYNTFYRYKKLHDFVKNHPGKFSVEDVKGAMSTVYARTRDKDEGALYPLPTRTLYALDYDLTDLTVNAKFYLKDGPDDPVSGEPTLIFSEPFRFPLKELSSGE